MTEEKKTNTAGTLKKYFGLKEGEKLGDFLEELKAMSPEEKAQLAEGIENGSETY